MSFRTPPPSPSSCDGKSRVDNSETNISLRLPESSVILQEGEPSEGDSAFLLGIWEFTNSEIDVATAKYSKVVGQGGFGTVYQGIYHDLHIVVKQLNRVCCMISMSVCVCVNSSFLKFLFFWRMACTLWGVTLMFFYIENWKPLQGVVVVGVYVNVSFTWFLYYTGFAIPTWFLWWGMWKAPPL